MDIDDLHQLVTNRVKAGPWGQLVTTAAGGTVQLTPKTLRQLIEHNDVRLRTVFTGGHEILGISKPTTYIPDALRTAALVRDGHAREPGSRLSAKHCDLHHVIPREQQGPTLLSNLLTTSRKAHPGLERDGPWEVKLADDGVATYTNRKSGRTLRTLPRSMRPLRPPRS